MNGPTPVGVVGASVSATLVGVAPASASVVGSCGTTSTVVVPSVVACSESPLYVASRVGVPVAPGSAINDRLHWPEPSRVHVPELPSASGPGVGTPPDGPGGCRRLPRVCIGHRHGAGVGWSNRERRGCATCGDGHRTECGRDLDDTEGYRVVHVARYSAVIVRGPATLGV